MFKWQGQIRGLEVTVTETIDQRCPNDSDRYKRCPSDGDRSEMSK